MGKVKVNVTRKGVRHLVGTCLILALIAGWLLTQGPVNRYTEGVRLAEELLVAGDTQGARVAAQQALAARPNDDWAVLLEGVALAQAGEVAQAAAQVGPVLQTYPQYRARLERLGEPVSALLTQLDG